MAQKDIREVKITMKRWIDVERWSSLIGPESLKIITPDHAKTVKVYHSISKEYLEDICSHLKNWISKKATHYILQNIRNR